MSEARETAKVWYESGRIFALGFAEQLEKAGFDLKKVGEQLPDGNKQVGGAGTGNPAPPSATAAMVNTSIVKKDENAVKTEAANSGVGPAHGAVGAPATEGQSGAIGSATDVKVAQAANYLLGR